MSQCYCLRTMVVLLFCRFFYCFETIIHQKQRFPEGNFRNDNLFWRKLDKQSKIDTLFDSRKYTLIIGMSPCPLYMEIHLSPGSSTNTSAADYRRHIPCATDDYLSLMFLFYSYLQIVRSFSKLVIILFSEFYIDGSTCRVDLAQLK